MAKIWYHFVTWCGDLVKRIMLLYQSYVDYLPRRNCFHPTFSEPFPEYTIWACTVFKSYTAHKKIDLPSLKE